MAIDPSRDAFGEEVKAYYENRKGVIEIVERDDGYIDHHDGVSYYFSAYDDWSEYEKSALSHCCGRIVDVGCGAGRIALHLQQKGHSVVGIDNSPGAIEVCRSRGVKELLTHLSLISGVKNEIVPYFCHYDRSRDTNRTSR